MKNIRNQGGGDQWPTPNTLSLLYDGKIDFGVVSEPSRPGAASGSNV